MVLNADPDVVGVVSQLFWFHWPDGSVMRQIISLAAGMVRRWSSLFATMTGCHLTISRSLIGRPRCASRLGWAYRRVGALDSVLRANLRSLSGHRHPRVRRPALAGELIEVFARARPLNSSVGAPLVVLPVLFHLLSSATGG